jgi:hypothetical protein
VEEPSCDAGIGMVGHRDLEGGVATIPVPPDPESLTAIRALGDQAIPVLEDYLWSASDRESSLAMRFLGAIGGRKIVGPLAKVAREYSSPGRRKTALLWLSQTPWDLAAPVLKNAMERDPNPKVRKAASDLLLSHKVN